MKPKHLDLFSGIGGFALAARWAGFGTIGFSEIDSYACRVLRKHWPTVASRVGKRLEGCQEKELQDIGFKGEVFGDGWSHDSAIEGMRERRDLPNARTLRSRKGVPNFVDRIRGIGNAINPQIAAQIMRLMT